MKRLLTGIILMVLTVSLTAQDKPRFNLEKCIQYAVQHNPTLKNAMYQMQIAKNTNWTRFSSWLPVVSAGASGTKNKSATTKFFAGEYVGDSTALSLNNIRVYDNYSYNLDINWNLFRGGANYWNYKKIKSDLEVQKANYANQLQTTILAIVEKYFDVVKQQQLLKVKKKAVNRSEEQFRRAETMYKLGAAAKIDKYRAEVNLGNDRMGLLQQQNSLENAIHQLNLAMGRNPLEPLVVQDKLNPELDMADISSLKQELLVENPALKNLKFRVKSAGYQKNITFANYLPSVTWFYRYSRSLPEFKTLFKDFDREYNKVWGLSFNINIFNGLRDYVNHQNAKISQKMVLENLTQQRQQLLSQLKFYYNQFNTYKKIRETNLLNLRAAEEEFKLANERYKIGSGTSLEQRDAQVKLSEAEQLLIESDYQLVLTKNQIKALLGQLKQ